MIVGGRPGAKAARRCLAIMLMVAFAATTVLPFLWMLSTALKRPEAPIASFLPGVPTLDNFARVFEVLPFGRFYLNSILVAFAVTFGKVATSALAAYAFARLEFRGRDRLFFAYLATMMLPGAVTMVPLFLLLTRMPDHLNALFGTTYFTDDLYFLGRWFAGRALGTDSYFVLIAPGLFTAYGTFMLRQFFLGIPRELDEAAMIDGCTRLQIFRNVVLPLSKPALATLATFTFMGTWGDFMWPMIMTNTAEMRTLPVGLQFFMGQYGAEWPVMMAGAMLMIAPKILVFVFCQRWFVEGIQVGGVKG
jgi:multiple sugar transport system permease protein